MSFNVPFTDVIGCKVWKNPNTNSKFEPKPFKSGLKINTVTGVIPHPITGRDAFTFAEDDSYVECHICSIAPMNKY